MPQNIQKQIDFLSLPETVRDWLGSLTVTKIIIETNEKHEIVGEQVKIIPRLITQLVTKMITPEELAPKLAHYLKHLTNKEINYIADQIKTRILKPVSGTLRSPFGVDINKIQELSTETSPRAKIVEFAKPHEKTPEPPKRIKDIAPREAVPQNPKARVTEFNRPDGLGNRAQDKSDIQAPKQTPGGPEAQVSDPRKPLTLVEKSPE